MNRLLRLLFFSFVVAAVATNAAPATPAAKPLKITSSLDGKAVLPIRIHWIARPSVPAVSVAQVDYLIDGRLAWVEHNAPFAYGSDGNWLVTTFLKPGRHTFITRVVTKTGAKAGDSVSARVLRAPPPPADLAGTWARAVPTGDRSRWTITINAIGWLFGDPHGGGQNQDVSYPRPGTVLVRAAIEEPVAGKYDRGGAFCDHEPDPVGLYRYTVSADGTALTLRAAANDCRRPLIQGTWMRVP